MEVTPVKEVRMNDINQLDKEWQKIAERLKKSSLPGLNTKKVDLADHTLVQQMIKYDPGLAAQLKRVVPEILDHPYFKFQVVDLEKFSVASPQFGSDKNLVISHASYMDAGVSAHFDSGIAAFHSDLMGNLGSECPSVALNYYFPNEGFVHSYNVEFRVFMYNLKNDQGANFQLVSSAYGYSGTAKTQHLDLPSSTDADTSRYLNIRVVASQVQGRSIKFELKHLDWSGSPVNWWFYSAKVTKTKVLF